MQRKRSSQYAAVPTVPGAGLGPLDGRHLNDSIPENNDSQEQGRDVAPENPAAQSARRAGSTPENAKLLAEHAGHLECPPLTGQAYNPFRTPAAT